MKKFLLLVEDDRELSEALVSYLGREGYVVIHTASVKEAVKKLRNQKFFCVITDIHLPSESGEDLIEFIREGDEKGQNRRVPILVISGFLDRPLAERLQKQVNGGLVKPFSLESLLTKLKSLG
jgi:two-component system response regulator MprA